MIDVFGGKLSASGFTGFFWCFFAQKLLLSAIRNHQSYIKKYTARPTQEHQKR
jgi:hypothetical protein